MARFCIFIFADAIIFSSSNYINPGYLFDLCGWAVRGLFFVVCRIIKNSSSHAWRIIDSFVFIKWRGCFYFAYQFVDFSCEPLIIVHVRADIFINKRIYKRNYSDFQITGHGHAN